MLIVFVFLVIGEKIVKRYDS